MQAVVMNETGDVDVLALTELPDPVPGPGQVLVQIAVAGINFMDIGVRRGMAWTELPNPKILGVEGAGNVWPGSMGPAAMRRRSPLRPARWCRFPMESTTRPLQR